MSMFSDLIEIFLLGVVGGAVTGSDGHGLNGCSSRFLVLDVAYQRTILYSEMKVNKKRDIP